MRIFLLLAALVVTLPVAAQDSGFYGGASVGGYSIDFDDIDLEIEDAAVGVYGGWQFMPYLAGELAYMRLLEGDDDILGANVDVETDVFAATINPTLPINESWALFAKLGWAWYSVDVKGLGQSDSEDEDDFTYGVGGEWKANRWGIRGEVNAIDADGADVYIYTIGAKFRF